MPDGAALSTGAPKPGAWWARALGRLRRLWRVIVLSALLVAALIVLARRLLELPGAPARVVVLDPVTVRFDDTNVPLVEGPTWTDVAMGQGYATASERLFQMDLHRRRAGGSLSHWFGTQAVESDRPRHLEGWPRAALRIVEALPGPERAACERYAVGVNRFISEGPTRWGVEYHILDVEPQPWRCADSVLVLLDFAAALSRSADADLARETWSAAMPAPWSTFLFADHPWATPLDGGAPAHGPLPSAALSLQGPGSPKAESLPAPTPGSNAWAWTGAFGTFLAVDSHLGYAVPGPWFLVRLATGPHRWVVGASLPGVPGVMQGMNPALAWTLTATSEDLDDYVVETLSEDGASYLLDEPRRALPPAPDAPTPDAPAPDAPAPDAPTLEDSASSAADPGLTSPAEVWAPIERRTSTLEVRDAGKVEIEVRNTRRGPLIRLPDGRHASRRWVPLQDDPRIARLPFFGMAAARNLDELDAAVAGVTLPPMNALLGDRSGRIAYRATGVGVKWDGERWAGLTDQRMASRADGDSGTRMFVTANQQIWVDGHRHPWASERRAERIRAALSALPDPTVADMEALQLDTESRYHRELLRWVDTHASPGDERRRRRWAQWSGDASLDPVTFVDALQAESVLAELLLAQMRGAWLGGRRAAFGGGHRDVWMIAAISEPAAMERFGLEPRAVADRLLKAAQVANRGRFENPWSAEHPLAERIPVLGLLFTVPHHAQSGWTDLVRTETPNAGSTLRLVWDLASPEKSSWAVPLGQSGHAGSAGFTAWHEDWITGVRRRVFTEKGELWP